MKTVNNLWKFFASVQLTLFTLGCLAVCSIIGTLIPQNKNFDFYIDMLGNKGAQFIHLFSIENMYSSWWFITLLILLSINLIICSFNRLPVVIQIIRQDNLALTLVKIRSNKLKQHYTVPFPADTFRLNFYDIIRRRRWSIVENTATDETRLFLQKNRWSRLAPYIVHLSILAIFCGALYGKLFGFKASLYLPERQKSDVVYTSEDISPIKLDFTVECERFDIEYYDNNMPKEYRSILKIIENGKEILKKEIEVNKPLKHKGITMYQASYHVFGDFLFSITTPSGVQHHFRQDFRKPVTWEENNLQFGVLSVKNRGEHVTELKIWFSDGSGSPLVFWMNNGESKELPHGNGAYLFSVKQNYATVLQVVKDPGVVLVYFGCTLLLIGLYMTFFLSHRRIWIIMTAEGENTCVELYGNSNKNRAGFEKNFLELAEELRNCYTHKQ